MRYVSIDLSSDNYLQQPKIFGGYSGEHNETVLQVKLPSRMIGIECSGYRFDFQTSEDNKISSPLIPISELNDDVLSFHLVEQLTIAGNLLFNVVAILSNETTVSLVSKTNTVVLCIEDSPEGNVQLADPNGYKDELQKMIDERILEINPAKVDQKYSPTSPNAQSGKAVAEAVSGKMDKFGTVEDFDSSVTLFGRKIYSKGKKAHLTLDDVGAALHSNGVLALNAGTQIEGNNKPLKKISTPDGTDLTQATNVEYLQTQLSHRMYRFGDVTALGDINIDTGESVLRDVRILLDAPKLILNTQDEENAELCGIATPDGTDPTQAVNVEFVKQTQRQTEAYANKTFASAVRNTSSGDLVKVSDVSPIEHELDVKITSKKEIENKVDISQLSTQTASDGTTFTNNGDGTFTITTNASNFYFSLNKTLKEICPTIQDNEYVTFYFEAEGNYEGEIGFTNGPTTIFEGETHTSTYKWSDYASSQPTFYIINGSYNGPVTIKNFKIGTATGEPIVEDLTTVSVTAQGKNIIPFPYIDTSGSVSSGVTFTVNEDGSVSAKGTSEQYAIFRLGNANNIHLKDGVSYVASCGYATRYLYVTYVNKDTPDNPIYWGNSPNNTPLVWSDKYTLLSVNIQFSPGNVVDMTLYPQIEFGEVVTEYEPYVEPFTVSANADGTVKGLMSISPSMTLMTDTADVTIDLVYNADTKMYIDNKFNELATALLNA